MTCVIVSLSVFTLALVAGSSVSAVSNYDALIDDINGRSQFVHDSFMNTPGVREHVASQLGSLYDDNGYVTPESADEDHEALWQRLSGAVQQARDGSEDELRDHRDKMQRASKMYDSPFLMEDEEEGEIAEPRSEEVPYNNHLWGTQKVSGGSGKTPDGSNKASFEVKTDRLPGYCDPPNPCPIGVDPEKLHSPCDKNIPNTKTFNKQWIWDKMERGECSCDTEHMNTCPQGSNKDRTPMNEDEKRNVHRSVVKKAGPYSAF